MELKSTECVMRAVNTAFSLTAIIICRVQHMRWGTKKEDYVKQGN
jgi:phenylpyruvate tautomerase PptA (4-oxalocrotonate tautomerase family)